MMNTPPEIKKKFDALYAEWQELIKSPRIQASSNPNDYTDNEPYQEIINLGSDVLPLVLEKIKAGEFFMNQAALSIKAINLDALIEIENKLPSDKRFTYMAAETPEFLSEQQKSEIILKHIEE